MWKIPAILCLAALSALAATGVPADTWRGTAPFCAGECLPGEEVVGVSDTGDGGYCITGKKVLCRNASTTCQPGPTELTCYGVVMVCDNGCSAYACGPCLGLDDVNILSQGGGRGPAVGLPCQQGYVWREAYAGDYVCVPPASRDRARADNAAAPGRHVAGSDVCIPGYVWRETVPADHVCVPPAVRSESRAENAAGPGRTVAPRQVVIATCKQGYVWREAITGDKVCVPPQTRAQAWADNAAAPGRQVPGQDACVAGYVWREVVPADHVCVTPEIRAQVRADTALAATRIAN